jgi:hypothetical protein
MTEKTHGVNYRALSDLFKLAGQRKGTFIYDIAVQMIEIYNEQVRDLLVSDGLNKRYPYCKNLSYFSLASFLHKLCSIGLLCICGNFISLTDSYIRNTE